MHFNPFEDLSPINPRLFEIQNSVKRGSIQQDILIATYKNEGISKVHWSVFDNVEMRVRRPIDDSYIMVRRTILKMFTNDRNTKSS